MPQFVAYIAFQLTNVDPFTKSYLWCAEWLAQSYEEDRPDSSLTDEEREELTGFTSDFLEQAIEDCRDFQEANEADLAIFYDLGFSVESAGIDFWLSRNRHGAGYFDRHHDPVCSRLQEAAKVYGEVDCVKYGAFLGSI